MDLLADCSACAAYCCVALPFDRSAAFAFDKPANVRCRHLAGDHTCTIHAERAARGMAGCARFDCLGAGQRVTRAFGSRAFDAFRVMREVHELASLLATAARLPLSDEDERRRASFEAALERTSSLDSLAAFDRSTLPGDIRAFFRSLARPL
jgi:hypothetical protein